MSLRGELVRLGLRWFVKRKIGPETTLEALRRQDAFVARLVPPPPKGIRTTHVDLDGVKAVAIVAPTSLGDRIVLYLHGGGYVSGSPALYRDFTWRIAAATRARTVILDQRLAPEHTFPAALDDAVTAYRALLADSADPRRMAVLGESSGGVLVLAMLLKLRDEGSRLLAAAVALSPWTDLALTGDSLQRNAAAMRRRSTPTRPDCRRRSSKSAATRSCSTIPCAWRSGCAPPDVRSSSKYGRACRTPGRSGRGSCRKRARPSSASARSCRAGCSRRDSTPSHPWLWRGADARRDAA